MDSESSDDLIVFLEALKLPSGERRAFLDQACAGNASLRREVEALIEAHESAADFLEQAPIAAEDEKPSSLVCEKPGDRIGYYKLLQQIGEGGYGTVYMAEQEQPVRRLVALKIIKPGMDTKSVIARFGAERQALALMDHPNIAKVFDADATDLGRPYFVMELVRGVKITEYCDQHSLTTQERLQIFIQVAQAVQHAHQKGIIHRDLKPSNILVTELTDGSPSPVIIDFGIAKATNQRLTDKTLVTAFGMLIGTPSYMSPEQASLASVDVDTRSDIYSLGILLYELLTGSPPFDAGELLKKGLDEIRRTICEEEAVRPSTRLTKMGQADLALVAQRHQSEPPALIRVVYGDLDWIVMKALEKDRRRRYETANGMARDLQRFLANEPVSARPPSTLYRFQKTVLRHKFLFAGAGVIASLFIVSLIIVSTSLAKEHQALQVAREALQQAEDDKAKAQQATLFLEEMLEGVGPSVALGRDTTMLREILDRTARRVDTELTNRPSVEAHLCSLVGRLNFEIGNYEQAEKMHRTALDLDRRLFGSHCPETMTALNDYGVTLWREGKQPEAETALKEAVATRRQLFGEENAEVAISLNNLANVYRHYQRPAEAKPLAREALRIRQKLFTRESLEAAESLRVLSILAADEGKPVEAETMAREVLAIRQKRLGPEHPLVASSLADVAWILERQGRLSEAKTLRSQALTMQQKLLGDLHPSSLDSLDSLAVVFESEGKWPEAEALRRHALALWSKKSGSESSPALEQVKKLVSDLMTENKFVEAEQVLNEELTPAFLKEPGCADILSLRVDLMARREKWQPAATDAALLVELQPADHLHYHMLATLLVKTQNRPAYEQLCKRIAALFADTKFPFVADRMAQDCLVMPNSGVDLLMVDKLADIAVSLGTNDVALPFFECCKAFSEYRLGRFQEAIDWAQKPLSSSFACGQAKAYSVMAMAYWQLGQKEVARTMLAKGESALPQVSMTPEGADIGDGWEAWLHARVSLDEATALVNAQPASGP